MPLRQEADPKRPLSFQNLCLYIFNKHLKRGAWAGADVSRNGSVFGREAGKVLGGQFEAVVGCLPIILGRKLRVTGQAGHAKQVAGAKIRLRERRTLRVFNATSPLAEHK